MRMENRNELDLTATINSRYKDKDIFNLQIGYKYIPYTNGVIVRISNGDNYGTKHLPLLPVFNQINFEATTFVGKHALEVA